jgi:Spy/CpxP family protein refolding chaperone
MKKYAIALTAFTIITLAANAQTKSSSSDATTQQPGTAMHHKQGNGMHKFHHRNMMMTQLNLTDAQKQQVKALNEDYNVKVKNLEKDDNITLKDYRTQKANFEQERKSKFQALLTTDQKNKIAQAKQDRSAKMKMMAQKRIDKMKTDLNLTDDQVAKMQAQRESSMEQMKAIRENSSLSEEQKKEQLMDLRKSSHESINSILTADQLKKKEELRNNRMSEWKNKKANKDS